MSVNKIPNNQFTQGLTVTGGLNVDSLIVNGTSITSGSGVTVSTDINNNSATNVPSTSVTYSLKQTNDNQTTQINTNTGQITELRAAMDAVYGGSALSWVGLGTVAFASGATFLQKSGGTMTGDVSYGTNNITAIKDVKFSNALIGGTLSNVYCSNVVASNVTATFKGDGSQLTNLPLDVAANFGTNSAGTVAVGAIARNLTLRGTVEGDITMGTTRSITGGKDFISSNAVISNNVYATGNVVASGNVYSLGGYFIGDGSKLTGITVTGGGTDATSATNICTVPIGSTTLNIGTSLNNTSAIRIGGSGNTPGVTVNSGNFSVVGSSASIFTTTDGNITLGKQNGSNQIFIQGSSIYVSQGLPSISATATHNTKQEGLLQTMVIPLSGEQGVIAQTSGAGVLPWVMFRAPFKMYIYGARMSCAQCSTSGNIQVDVRYYPQNTVPTAANMNSTTGTSIFTSALQIDQGLYSSVGSTAGTGAMYQNFQVVQDDGLIGVYIPSAGTNVLGLKLTLYFTYYN
jgi:hypothetical protein